MFAGTGIGALRPLQMYEEGGAVGSERYNPDIGVGYIQHAVETHRALEGFRKEQGKLREDIREDFRDLRETLDDRAKNGCESVRLLRARIEGQQKAIEQNAQSIGQAVDCMKKLRKQAPITAGATFGTGAIGMILGAFLKAMAEKIGRFFGS